MTRLTQPPATVQGLWGGRDGGPLRCHAVRSRDCLGTRRPYGLVGAATEGNASRQLPGAGSPFSWRNAVLRGDCQA